MIPEFVGRLPVMVTLNHLRRDDLVQILTEPKNALTKQYAGLFQMEGADLTFSKDGLEGIASIAIERETGGRALRSILEGILLDVLYELPHRKDTREFVIDADVVYGRRSLAIGEEKLDIQPEPAPTPPPDSEEPPASEARESA